MKYNILVIALLAIVSTLGCSKSSQDIARGTSIRISGSTHKRVFYHLRQYRVEDGGTQSSTDYGNGQVSTSSGEILSFPMSADTTGCLASLLVPFDDTVTLEVVVNGKVVDSKTSNKAGTVLTIELGKLPQDPPQPFDNYKIDPVAEEFRESLIQSFSQDNFDKINFIAKDTEAAFIEFTKALTKKLGKPAVTDKSQWVLAETPNGDVVQGSVQFGDKTVPMVFGMESNKIPFIVVEFKPGTKWTPVEKYRDHIDALLKETKSP